jgi:hypothetical protein
MNPREIIGAWLAGILIWAAAMVGLIMFVQPAGKDRAPSPGPGMASVEDWYSTQWQANEQYFEWDEADRPVPPAVARRYFGDSVLEDVAEIPRPLPPLAPPSGQQGADHQQDDQPSRQQ